jgi:hypothetical protein
MSKVISLQVCGIVLDELYHNACKSSVDQVSTEKIAKKCEVAIKTILAFRNILISRKLLIVTGKGRGTKTEWNKSYSAMNPEMAKSIYKEYIGEERKTLKLKVKTSKPKAELTLESVLSFLTKNGYTGTISKQVNSYTVETITLSNYKGA